MSRKKNTFNESTIIKIRIKLSELKDGRNDKPSSKTTKGNSDRTQAN